MLKINKVLKILLVFLIGAFLRSGTNLQADAQTNTFPPSGNVGIGTLSPNLSCEIEHRSSVCNAKVLSIVSELVSKPVEPAMLELCIKSDSVPAADEIGNIRFIQGDKNRFHVAQFGATSVGDPAKGADFKFYTNARLGFLAMTIKNNGNVGIGTNAPVAKLHIDPGVIAMTGANDEPPSPPTGTMLLFVKTAQDGNLELWAKFPSGQIKGPIVAGQ